MDTPAAKFSFSLLDGALEIEGSEEFVSREVGALRAEIATAMRNVAPVRASDAGPDDSANSALGSKVAAARQVEGGPEISENPYPRVLDVIGDKLKVTTSIKGKTLAERSVTLILVYLWGKEKLLGQPTAEYKELRDLCEEHACLDSGNFSSTLSSKKNLIVVDGAKGSSSKICKLTYPGREEAETELARLSEGPK